MSPDDPKNGAQPKGESTQRRPTEIKSLQPDATTKKSTDSNGIQDAQNRVQFLVRLLYLTYYMAIGCINSFLPLYYRSLGYNGTTVGFLGAVTPFTTFIAGPLWGILSDTSGDPFMILYITVAVSVIAQVTSAWFDGALYMTVTILIKSFFSAPVKALVDSLAMDSLTDRSQFGKLRLFAIVGTGLGTFMGGYILTSDGDVDTPDSSTTTFPWTLLSSFIRQFTGFRGLFIIHVALHLPVLLCIRQLQRQYSGQAKAGNVVSAHGKKVDEKGPLSQVKELSNLFFNDVALLFFFSAVFMMGFSAAIGENFSYVRFEEVGLSGSHMGASRLVCSLGGALMFWYSGSIRTLLGTKNVMTLAFLAYALRFSLVYKMEQPYYGYLAEGIRGMTFGCFWGAATVYLAEVTPRNIRSTVLQILNGIYNGIGRSTGAIVGGKMQSEIGTVTTFYYGYLLNAGLAALFFVYTFVTSPSDISRIVKLSTTPNEKKLR